MKKYLISGGLASILMLGACGSDDAEVGEDASETDQGTGDQDEADNAVGEPGPEIDGEDESSQLETPSSDEEEEEEEASE